MLVNFFSRALPARELHALCGGSIPIGFGWRNARNYVHERRKNPDKRKEETAGVCHDIQLFRAVRSSPTMGSFRPEGAALPQRVLESDFRKIYSIELSPKRHEKCVAKFREHISSGRVKLSLGDSVEFLPKILDSVDEKATFWLDAHWSGPRTDTARGPDDVPLIRELAIIAGHHVKTHTILIDDVRLFGKRDEVDWSTVRLDEVSRVLAKINPEYRIFFESGHVPNDVLVAEIS